LSGRAASILAGAAAVVLLATVGLGQARTTRVHRVCRRSGHRRVCRKVHVKPPKTRTRTATTSSTSSTSSSVPTLQTTTSTSAPAATVSQTATTTTTTSTSAPALPSGTEVDERATGLQSPLYALDANAHTFAAGTVHFNVYNYDQDPHTLAVETTTGQQIGAAVAVPAGSTGKPVSLTVNLPPGTYVLFCTLPEHAAERMETTIVVE
jgi:hypothetical protein